MGVLHVAPGDSAGHSLRQAVEASGRDELVIRHTDDLSCGPIASDDPMAREAWWAQFFELPEGADSHISDSLMSFWDRIATTDNRLVIWFGRHSAMELAFYLAWADRLGDRPYDIVDVTGLKLPFTRQDGSRGIRPPAQAASLVSPEGLRSLLDRRRPITDTERENARQDWRHLREENAPFRIVAEAGLISAPTDYFDQALLKQAATEWRRVASVVGDTMGINSEPICQVSDLMLLTRVIALVEDGKLLADTDPIDMRTSRVRLPD